MFSYTDIKKMELFKKKEKKEEISERIPRLPELPNLPELPEVDDYSNMKLSQLPSYPNDSFGNKFSQDSIKEAVTGKKEVEEEDADDLAIRGEMQTMQTPRVKEEENKRFYSNQEKDKIKEVEPLFIRIDKFEEGSRAFGEVKKQLSEIGKLFNDLKMVKENEEREIKTFESEIKQIKDKLDEIDKNIFSKIG